MPVIIPNNLPAKEILKEENIFTIEYNNAVKQDIRALKILIMNLMPLKIDTETDLLRLLTNSALQIEIELIHPSNHESKNTPKEHLEYFYKSFNDVKQNKYDGLIITGAPVEHLEFESVDYWNEVKDVMEWSKTNVTSVLFICWAAQAGLYHFYRVNKQELNKKMFGNFAHKINNKKSQIVRGFDDTFYAPHSRYTAIKADDINKISELEIISESNEAGIYIVTSKNLKHVFVTGHSEYGVNTLKNEYERDLKKGIGIQIPANYFPENNPEKQPFVNWKSHANLLFQNWLNYYVYQITPFELS
ncbi:MAG: homoserine O-succinyltransferase [Bacteroidetes bacterium GWA2_31_9]|nr:MAG: homoserine O-succinyltransferase [Bacteroidetes bacterium GWA2_31_9]